MNVKFPDVSPCAHLWFWVKFLCFFLTGNEFKSSWCWFQTAQIQEQDIEEWTNTNKQLLSLHRPSLSCFWTEEHPNFRFQQHPRVRPGTLFLWGGRWCCSPAMSPRVCPSKILHFNFPVNKQAAKTRQAPLLSSCQRSRLSEQKQSSGRPQ